MYFSVPICEAYDIPDRSENMSLGYFSLSVGRHIHVVFQNWARGSEVGLNDLELVHAFSQGGAVGRVKSLFDLNTDTSECFNLCTHFISFSDICFPLWSV